MSMLQFEDWNFRPVWATLVFPHALSGTACRKFVRSFGIGALLANLDKGWRSRYAARHAGKMGMMFCCALRQAERSMSARNLLANSRQRVVSPWRASIA